MYRGRGGRCKEFNIRECMDRDPRWTWEMRVIALSQGDYK